MADEGSGQQQNEVQGAIRRSRRTSIPCPKCGGRRSYSNHYTNPNEHRVRRGRRCADCGEKFVTVEISADTYKRLMQAAERAESVDTYKRNLDAWAARERERHEALANGFSLINGIVEREKAQLEEDRKWQRENPTEAFKSILPPAVFEYLNDWARREGKSLIELIAGQLTLDCDIDIDLGRGERPENELDRWWEKLHATAEAYLAPTTPSTEGPE